VKSTNHIGIWMDHSIAHLIELKNNAILTYTIESKTFQNEKQNFGKDESLQQNKEKKHFWNILPG
jgi:hypothetical protein